MSRCAALLGEGRRFLLRANAPPRWATVVISLTLVGSSYSCGSHWGGTDARARLLRVEEARLDPVVVRFASVSGEEAAGRSGSGLAGDAMDR